jgi:hypothetical protein
VNVHVAPFLVTQFRCVQSLSIIERPRPRRSCGLKNWSSYIGPKVSQKMARPTSNCRSSHYMPSPNTPPNSQSITSGTTLSDTTPLRRDIPGSAAHTSTPPKKASERYADMTFDNCDRFVGPMPVKDFLKEFLPPPAVPASRPQGDFAFSEPSVSQNENAFASPSTLIKCTHADRCFRLRQFGNLGYAPTYTL